MLFRNSAKQMRICFSTQLREKLTVATSSARYAAVTFRRRKPEKLKREIIFLLFLIISAWQTGSFGFIFIY